MTRAIVIGAGANGMVCALHLAQAGVEVSVLERAGAAGGAVRSADGPLPGFRHDICAAFFPLTRASPAFAAIPLELDWVTPDTVMAHPFRDGRAIALERDVAATAASLEAAAPGAGAAWQRFMPPLLRQWRTLSSAALGPFPPLRAGLRAAAGLRLDALRLGVAAASPAGTLGLRLFRDERAAAWLAGSGSHGDLAPSQAPGGALTIGLKLLGHAVGWPFPRGGAQAITDQLAGRLERMGGQVRTNAAVGELLIRDRRAHGVRLTSGERFDADVVVATVTAEPFLAMLPAGALPAGPTRRLEGWRHEMGTFKVDFALSGPVPWTADECRRAGVVHIGDTLDALAESFDSAQGGHFPAEPALVVGQQSLFDDSRAPAGSHTLYVYTRSPLQMDIGDEQAADIVEQRLEQFAPGFRALVLGRVVRGPDALQAHDAALVRGDLGGGSYRLDQQLFLRPHPRMFRTQTPVRGLWFAGSSAHPGGGVHGAQGMSAARLVLRALDRD